MCLCALMPWSSQFAGYDEFRAPEWENSLICSRVECLNFFHNTKINKNVLQRQTHYFNMVMTTPNMLDTDILLQDRNKYSNDFSTLPPLTDLMDSVVSDSFSSDMYWSYDSCPQIMDSILDPFYFERMSVPDVNTLGEEWESSLKIDDLVLEEKPLLSHFEILKENNEPSLIVKPEPQTSNDNIVVHTQRALPEVDTLSTLQFFENSEDNLAENDLPSNLDLCSFINDDNIPPVIPIEDVPKTTDVLKATDVPKATDVLKATEVPKATDVPKIKAGRKKIDIKAQRYIVENENEDEEIDIETVFEGGNNPVLEAGDVHSLLEQFEAASVKIEKVSTDDSIQKITPSSDEEKYSTSSVPLKAQTSNKTKPHCKNDVKGRLHNATKNASEQNKSKYVNASVKKLTTSGEQKRSSVASAKKPNNKQIIEELPQELINRIRESGKRKGKGISIIDPVPTSGGKKKKTQENFSVPRTISATSEFEKIHNDLLNISLDHCYYRTSMQPKKAIKKDPISVSSEEENKTIQNQPIIKNSDGKLMISLLKVNTIKTNLEENKKKKLNIEEYKKRRFGSLSTPHNSSLSNSPISSNCSSPLPTEDENTRRMKHEEKLRKMALELLKTSPKSSSNASTDSNDVIPVKIEKAPPIRNDMDVITYVSIGINTDITGRDPLAPAEKLEEIKPLLENANVKISSNSLINSLIENIPNVIKPKTSVATNDVIGHEEDRTIMYLPKIRKLPERADIGVQTSISLLGNIKRRYRRREDSTSSSSSDDSENRSNKRYNSRYSRSSRSSRSTSISSSSSRSSSRSVSRSPSPTTHKRKREYMQEVEERRVIYVGKIAPDTTKEDLYYRFSKFGVIKSISLHFRDHGYTNLDNYGFVTFKNKEDAYRAFEHGNDNPCDPQYSLSFGGRRLFCRTNYSDLDNMTDNFDYPNTKPMKNSSGGSSFDRLLMEMQQTLKKRRL